MTPTLIQILTREFQSKLLSTRLSHIAQSSNETVELSLYHPDRPTYYLTIALFPSKPFLFASLEKSPALPKPPNFCRSLRKHLEYAQLIGIEAELGERVLHFLFKMPDGLYHLVFEGLPKYPNFILVGPDNLIISALRYKNEVERPVLPQVPYKALPPSADKPNFWTVDENSLAPLWEEAGRPPAAAWLKNEFRGMDAELAAYLESFGDKVFQEWAQTKKDIAKQRLNHFTWVPGPPPALKIFPGLVPAGPEAKVFPTANEALVQLFRSESLYRGLLSEKSKLEHEINKTLKHEKRILEKLKKDRSEAEKSDQYQHWGELVMAQLHKIKFHMSQVDLEDVVRGGPDAVTIPLDPSISPLHNAQRFFKKAQKGSRGLELVDKREKEIQERVNQLKSAQRSVPALQTAGEIKKAFQELFPKKKEIAAKPKKAKEEKIPTPNITRTKLNKQFELCVGTSAAANEYVTFQLAQPEDLWFHVRDLPGAHVILRRLQRDSEIPDEMVLLAAKEAAAHSKAQPGSKVSVSYTLKKFVKKIPGAPMGMVSMTKEKSLVIEVPAKDA